MFTYFGGNNQFYIQKVNPSSLWFVYEAGGVSKITVKTSVNPAGWFFVGMSWKDGDSGDEKKSYYNGQPEGSTQTGFGSFVTRASGNFITIGAGTTAPTVVWDGWLGYMAYKFGSVWSDADMLGIYNAASTAGPD